MVAMSFPRFWLSLASCSGGIVVPLGDIAHSAASRSAAAEKRSALPTKGRKEDTLGRGHCDAAWRYGKQRRLRPLHKPMQRSMHCRRRKQAPNKRGVVQRRYHTLMHPTPAPSARRWRRDKSNSKHKTLGFGHIAPTVLPYGNVVQIFI